MLPPDNTDDILFLIQNLESQYKDMWASYDEDEAYYEGLLDDEIEIPDAGYTITIPATGRAVIDEATDNVDPVDIWVRYEPRLNSRGRPTQELQDQADRVRQFLNSWFQWNRKVGSDIDPVRSFIKDLFLHGKAVMKCHVDWRYWPVISDEEIEAVNSMSLDEKNELADRIEHVRSTNTPLIFRSVNPRYVIEDPTIGGKKLWIVERYDMKLSEIVVWFKAAIDKEFGEEWWQRVYPNDAYTVHEFWSADWFSDNGKFNRGKHVVYINEEAVIDEDNPYVEIPYVVKYSGFGYESYQGEYHKKSVGLFTKQVKSLILAEARRVTQFDGIISQMAWPITFLPDDLDQEEINLGPGGINMIPRHVFENMGAVFVTPKILDAEYLNSLNFLASQIQRGTVGPTLRGAGVPGTDSAAQYNSINAQGKLRLSSVKEATENGIADMMSKALCYIETILKDEVSVPVGDKKGSGKYVLKPSDIGGKWDVDVEFKPDEDSIKERKIIVYTQARGAGMNPYDAYLIAGYENPEEMIAKDLVYQILFSEPVVKGIAKDLAQEWGIDVDEVEVQTAMEEGVKQSTLQQFMNELFNGGDMRGEPADPALQQQMAGGGPPPIEEAIPPEGGGGLPPNVPGMEQPPGRPPVPVDPATSDIMGMINSLRGGF